MNTEVWQERAKALLEKSEAENHFVIKDSGVWNACESGLVFDDFPVDCEIERCDAAWTFAFNEWKPALAIPELADKDVPSLPFPFTAPELAAFMLYGMGALVGDFFGDWEDGPSIQSLNELPAGQSELRALVKGAYVAYRLAREQVDELDMGVGARETAARKAYRNSPRDRELSQAFVHAKASWDAAHRARLTAMVRCLLGVGVDIESSAPATGAQPQAAPLETPVQRRARWLDWYGKGEHGALQRVHERELLLNPKADRSYIGKQIKVARAERGEQDTKKSSGAWAAQLVTDGKRNG